MIRIGSTWTSSDGADRRAIELITPDASVPVLAEALQCAEATDQCAFVVLSIAYQQPGWLQRANLAVARAGGRQHVCIAVGGDDLPSPQHHDDRLGHASLVLDVGCEATSFAAFTHARVEGVVFRNEWALRARRSLRASAVLGAMTGLARDLGLATLGPGQPSATLHDGLRPFDYFAAAANPGLKTPTPQTPRFELSR